MKNPCVSCTQPCYEYCDELWFFRESKLREYDTSNWNISFLFETLEETKKHYIPINRRYISCKSFGESDGMNGACHWCLEMTPLQHWMCRSNGYFWKRTYDENKKLIQSVAEVMGVKVNHFEEF